MTSYNKYFYDSMKDLSLSSAEIIVPQLVKLFDPRSVLDLGCGVGNWLSIFNRCGVNKIHGFDGGYVKSTDLVIDKSQYNAIDLSSSFPPSVKVDIAISLEVAEHISLEYADAVVDFLTSCSDVVYFGAAIPQQGGTDHINEQWQSYWVQKFLSRGYSVSTQVRDAYWGDSRVAVWYRQNALLYFKSADLEARGITAFHGDPRILDVVHPDLFAAKMNRYRHVEAILAKAQKAVNAFRS